jgi:hypothetical protein
MAEPLDDELSMLDFELDTSDLDPIINDPAQNSAANQNAISDFDRFIATNLFDTQPEKRKQYLKQLGYEMNPKDDNLYRPIGSKGNYREIDPDNSFLGFIPAYKVWTEEGRKELARDFGDIAYDTLEGVGIGAASASAFAAGVPPGAAGGAAIGAPLGPGGAGAGASIGGIVGGLGAAGAAGAAAKAASENFKSVVGNFMLDEDIPLDVKRTMYQSLTAGTFSAAGTGLGKMVNNWSKINVDKAQDALKEAAIRKSGGTFNQNLMDDLIKNPQQYTQEAVKDSTKKLLSLRDEIFGTSAENPTTTRQLTGGIAKDKIGKLNKQADLEIEKLSQMDEANFTVEEIVDVMRDRLKVVGDKTFQTDAEIKAAKYFRKELDRVMKRASEPAKSSAPVILDEAGNPIQSQAALRELTFKEGRDLLKSWQNAAFQEGPIKDNPVAKSLANGLKELADEKAQALGSNLKQINSQRSEILSTYKDMQRMIKDGTMQNAFVGKDSISKEATKRMFEKMDDVLGTEFGPTVEKTQFQSAVEKLYNSPSAFGSGSVIGDALREGFKSAPSEAFKFGTLGGAIGAATPGGAAQTASALAGIGAVKGFAEGAKRGATLSSPSKMLGTFTKQNARIDRLAKLGAEQKASEAAAAGAQRALGLGQVGNKARIAGLGQTAATTGGAREFTEKLMDMPPEGPVANPAQPPVQGAGESAIPEDELNMLDFELDLSDLDQ